MNEVAEPADIIVITKNDQPVAQLAPIVSRPATHASSHKSKIDILGDIVGPMGEPWNSECSSSYTPTP